MSTKPHETTRRRRRRRDEREGPTGSCFFFRVVSCGFVDKFCSCINLIRFGSASLLVSLDDSERRGEEVELFAQTVLQEALEREVQSALAARREDDEGRRAHGDLRDVLHVQTRLPSLDGRGRGRRATRRHDALEEGVQLRGRGYAVARLVRAQRGRKYSVGPLPRDPRSRD